MRFHNLFASSRCAIIISAMHMPPADAPAQTPAEKCIRLVALTLLICGIGAAMWFAGYTETGQRIFDDSAAIQMSARQWVEVWPVLTVVAFTATYLLFGMLLLPIWWLQILAGFAFGLAWGCAYALAAAALTATVTTLFSRWLAGDWFRANVEAHIQRVQNLEKKLGNNGLLVVMAVRLASITPFGISNYLFGLTRIKPIEVFFGSVLGGFPALTIYVTLGADPRQFESPRYWLTVGLITLALVMPLALRYLWPKWFRKLGVE